MAKTHKELFPLPPPPPSSLGSPPPHACLPSTQAGLALVVPAIWPFLQAQRAVCLAMVRRGWLLSLSSVTISHVPAASWPGNDIAPQEAGSEGQHRKQQKTESACQRVPITVQSFGSDGDTWWSNWGHGVGAVCNQTKGKYIFEALSHVTAHRNYSVLSFWDRFRQIRLTNVQLSAETCDFP